MDQIVAFAQVRTDGKLVPSDMTVEEMAALGWGPSKVVALRWIYRGEQVTIDGRVGVHGIVVPGANFVAALLGGDETHPNRYLVIFSPDGSVHGKINGPISISGREHRGTFGWFEPAMTPAPNMFGAVFQTDRQAALRCDVDASRPALTGAIKVQQPIREQARAPRTITFERSGSDEYHRGKRVGSGRALPR